MTTDWLFAVLTFYEYCNENGSWNVQVAEEESKDKKLKGCSQEDSKLQEQKSTNKNTTHDSNNKKEPSDASKDNSKVSEVPKPDYIHVRARRGQATDSHSLAERVSEIY